MWTKPTFAAALFVAASAVTALAADPPATQPSPGNAAAPAPTVCARCGWYCAPGFGPIAPAPSASTTQPSANANAPLPATPGICPFYGNGGRGYGRMGMRGFGPGPGPRDGNGPRRDGSCFWRR
ncbi:MAG: hypothetical protein ACTHN5_22660 [Phycisphaerae bacterium]